jgi:hypothetical protein
MLGPRMNYGVLKKLAAALILSPIFILGPLFVTAQISSSSVQLLDTATATSQTSDISSPEIQNKFVGVSDTGGMLIKQVGNDLTVRTAPLGFVAYDGGLGATSSKLFSVNKQLTGLHTVNISQNDKYVISVAACRYAIGTAPCTITDLTKYTEIATTTVKNGYYSVPVAIGSGLATKIVIKYSLKSESIGYQPKSWLKVSLIGYDSTFNTTPDDAGVAVVTFPTQKVVTGSVGNPSLYALPSGILGFSVTNIQAKGYTVTAGICQYAGGLKDCVPASYSTASCIDGICSLYMPYITGSTQKIVYKYTPGTTFYTLKSDKENIIVTRNASTSLMVTARSASSTASQLSFTVSGLPNGVTARWNETGCVPTPLCSMRLTLNTASSTPIGLYPLIITSEPLNKKVNVTLVVTSS